jgi:hypothetical protein
VHIQLALYGIGRISELIGAGWIGKHPHYAIFLAWLLLSRGKFTYKPLVCRSPLHIVALALAHGCARFLSFQGILLVLDIREV